MPIKKPNIVFSHGKESGPWGSKITNMSKHAESVCTCDIHSINYQNIKSPEKRVEKLIDYLKVLESESGNEFILVGSSMGAYVSTVAAKEIQIAGLMLLAPALFLKGYEISTFKPQCNNISLIHGWNDRVVPYQNAVKFAAQHQAKLTLIKDGHRLSNSADVLNHELEQIIKNSGYHTE